MKLQYTLAIFLMSILSIGLSAQANESSPPSSIGTAGSMTIVPSLSSRQHLIPAEGKDNQEMMDGRSAKYDVVPGKGAQEENDFLGAHPNQRKGTVPGKTPSLVFDMNTTSLGSPSDPAIGVGPNHMVGVFNTGIVIYDKDGGLLMGPLSESNIFGGSGCCDLTVSYDNAADRWVLCLLGSGMDVAVSDGPDPTTAEWYVYNLPQIADYNKLSVWSDGYYITQNGGPNRVYAMERDAMLAGEPAGNVGVIGFNPNGFATSGFSSGQVLNISDDNTPGPGNATLVYLQDDAWTGVNSDHVKLWNINVDWATPGNSGISTTATQIAATPFISVFDGGSFSNLAQPGGGSTIDALQATIMNQAQFRKFSDHNSALFNFVVDADASSGKLAAVRWYELRQDADGMPWTVFQEGTYTAPDGKHAWNASLMMDQYGNIGMGYSGMAGPDTPNPTSKRVSSYYTGRFSADPAGTMTVGEELIAAGTGNISGTRFGDYSKIDIDPSNDKEFWFANEYVNSIRRDVVGVFQIASDFNNDIGVITIDTPEDGTLSATEPVSVTIFNFGLMDVSGFDVQYQVDGGVAVIEPYVGTITSGTTATFTFATTADLSTIGQTYTIASSTILAADEFNDNDGVSKQVTFLDPNDVGVVAFSSPVSGSGLTAAETVTVTIRNFGAATQTSIPVYYTLNGGAPVQETYTGSLAQGESDSYTFTATADLSSLGDHEFVAGSALTGDANPDNDETATTVTNFICQPEANCDGFEDGLTDLQLADQDLSVTCGGTSTGYTDDTDIIFNFPLGDNPFNGVLQAGYQNTGYVIYIDFNDNYTFEASEIVAQGEAVAAGTNYNFSVDFESITGVTSGMHIMRVRAIWLTGDGELLDPCGDAGYGRTNDYTANISGSVGIEDLFSAENFSISTLADNQFALQFVSDSYTDNLPVTVYDLQGQTLAFYTLSNNGNGYMKTIDMSYVAAGVYFIKVGSDSANIVKRIVVK